jgi:CRISPR-associated protein Csx17
MAELVLRGCAPEPLLSYLKALGVLRLVSEQADSEARGYWRNDSFVLTSRFGTGALEHFFEHNYQPTPIVVPWSGQHFFGVNDESNAETFKNTPTKQAVIRALLNTTSDRLRNYRDLITVVLDLMEETGFRQNSGGTAKARFLAALRSKVSEKMLPWLDAAALIRSDGPTFNGLLGVGGGNEGNFHLSDNFMQSLWDCLPDFDVQRSGHRDVGYLKNALYDTPVEALTERTPSLFDSGAVGGPNASSGFEGGSLVNPWNFILGLEGTLLFAGAVTKKLDAAASSAFPFTVSLSAAGYGTAARKEEGQREIWLPLWIRPASFAELRAMFAEGRAQVGSRSSRTGSDFGRALASYGVDRGISSFTRYAFVKGRVGGDNYNTAVPLGRFDAGGRESTDLLLNVDGWIEQFRRAANDKDAPPRFGDAARRIDAAILDFCRWGGASRMAAVLRALGRAERAVAGDPKRRVPPVGPLSVDWIAACNDGSPEYRLAASLASICGDPKAKVGDLRTDIEPVERGKSAWRWTSGDLLWNAAPLARNLAAVIDRRTRATLRGGQPHPALWARLPARQEDVATFLWGSTDDRMIEELLWGLALVDREQPWPALPAADGEDLPLPRLFALLKLVFLPGTLRLRKLSEEVSIAPEPEILGRLRAHDRAGAARLAIRRLQASGLAPCAALDESAFDPAIGAERFAAALLFPVHPGRLAEMVLQKSEGKKEET